MELEQSLILVIGEDPGVAGAISAQLRSEPVVVRSATDAVSGVNTAAEAGPSLVLLDLSPAHGGGLAALRALKADARTIGIPVVMITGAGDGAGRAAALELGAADFLARPFDGAEVRARVASMLNQRRLAELLEQRAMIDALTGLGSRRSLERSLERELALAARTGAPVGVLAIDPDGLSRLNDAEGHAFGDAVLRELARVIRSSLRISDVPCRNGSGFAVVLPNTDAAGAAVVGERIRAGLEAARWPRKPAARVTASFGAVSGVVGADDVRGPGGVAALARGWLDSAERAMAAARAGGGNRVVVGRQGGSGEGADAGNSPPPRTLVKSEAA
ncbi:MAG: diguanylate cyclase [Phycisphaerales bacterium]|nr:diguanylate cyclase [Phycisphaerales bacterium]